MPTKNDNGQGIIKGEESSVKIISLIKFVYSRSSQPEGHCCAKQCVRAAPSPLPLSPPDSNLKNSHHLDINSC